MDDNEPIETPEEELPGGELPEDAPEDDTGDGGEGSPPTYDLPGVEITPPAPAPEPTALGIFVASDEFRSVWEKVSELRKEFYPNPHLDAVETGMRGLMR